MVRDESAAGCHTPEWPLCHACCAQHMRGMPLHLLLSLPDTLAMRRYENTEARAKKVAEKGLMYMGMGVSGGEEGARNGARTASLLGAKHGPFPARQAFPGLSCYLCCQACNAHQL